MSSSNQGSKVTIVKPSAKVPKKTEAPLPKLVAMKQAELEVSHSHSAEVKNPLTTSPLSPQDKAAETKTQMHPKGHKPRSITEVWRTMDQQAYLRPTDTLTLGDVWIQPTGSIPERGAIAMVSMIQMLHAPHIKYRNTHAKMSTDDLLKVLYLCDSLRFDFQAS